MIKLLSKVGISDVSSVGGKAASLGELIKLGINVPSGFVVTTEAFRAGMSKRLEEDILRVFDEHKMKRVAVRSSAIAEDSSSASWAGQLETYLNVTRNNVIQAVRACWESINSDHALAYAEENKVTKAHMLVAVVVQSMVDSEISGVIFTADPVSNDRNKCIIESVFGLGEMLVQGSVTPENLFIEKTSGKILSRQEHSQAKMLTFTKGKNQVVSVPVGRKHILSKAQIKQLLKISRRIETHYKSPQDIEWAIQHNTINIVQARPITSLTDVDKRSDKRQAVIDRSNVFRWGPVRVNYFMISDYIDAVYKYLPKAYKGEKFPDALILFNADQMVWVSDMSRFVSQGKRVFMRYIENLAVLKKMHHDWQEAVSKLTKFQTQIEATTLANLTDKQLLKLWHDFYALIIEFWVPTLLAEFGNYGSPEILKEELGKYAKTEEELIKVQETLTAPEELSFYQQEEIDLVRAKDLKKHQSNYFWIKNSYGHVDVLPIKFFAKRQIELAGQSIKVNNIKKNITEAKTRIQQEYGLPEELMVRAKLISDNIVWQDHRKRVMCENFHYKNMLLAEFGRRSNIALADMLKLSFEEVPNLLKDSSKNKVAQGQRFGLSATNELSPLTVLEAREYWDKYAYEIAPETKDINGTTASKGATAKVQGKVRVLRTSHESLEKGEILVTTMTSPGYVFAMRNAVAVITDVGGLTSHAAIVSRELGIPCIVGTKTATQVLRTGDIVEVDGDKGSARIVERSRGQ
jgi:phosphohistidine swiveling domain-containing protein